MQYRKLVAEGHDDPQAPSLEATRTRPSQKSRSRGTPTRSSPQSTRPGPGIVIGRGGQRVDELRGLLEKKTGRRVRLNIQEISQPEQDAFLVARNIADQLERRVSYRRAIRQSATRSMQTGIQGIKIMMLGQTGRGRDCQERKA